MNEINSIEKYIEQEESKVDKRNVTEELANYCKEQEYNVIQIQGAAASLYINSMLQLCHTIGSSPSQARKMIGQGFEKIERDFYNTYKEMRK